MADPKELLLTSAEMDAFEKRVSEDRLLTKDEQLRVIRDLRAVSEMLAADTAAWDEAEQMTQE